MIGWKHIDTAPRTGQSVLLFSENGDRISSNHPTRTWVGSLLLSGNYWHPAMHGWDLSQDIAPLIEPDMKPTHWMPLPELPPKAEPASAAK